jgi:hypothetical protein
MYPDAPVTRQRNGDGLGQRGVEGGDSAIGRFLAGLNVWPCARSARTPRSLPSRPGGAVSPCGRMGHGVQRRQRGDGQAAGLGAVRWPAAATSAAGQIEKPTWSASLLLSPARRSARGGPTAICGTSYRIELCISAVPGSQVAVQPGMYRWIQGMPLADSPLEQRRTGTRCRRPTPPMPARAAGRLADFHVPRWQSAPTLLDTS